MLTRMRLLERLAYIATIIAAIIAAVSVLVAGHQFKATQGLERDNLDLEREAKAVDLFVKYNEMMRGTAARTSVKNPETVDWRSNLAIGIAESIFRLRSNDSGWVATVGWILQNEDRERVVNDLDCTTYDPRFVLLAAKTLGHSVCMP